MNNIHLSPPHIVHGGNRPPRKHIPDIVNKAAENARMTQNERKLLLYLAEQAEGFTPAKQTIENNTGIDKTDIKKVRNRLQRLSVIDFVNTQYDHFIFINWVVIRGYALLSEPLKVGGRKRQSFTQDSQCLYQGHPINDVWKMFIELFRRDFLRREKNKC